MPELPEVEMVCRGLRDLLPGTIIEQARLLRPGLAPDTSPRAFAARLRGGRIGEIGRRGKHILIHLEKQQTLVVHLRMTGRFLYMDTAAENPKHTHAAFRLDNGHKLLFTDQRHFGTMALVETANLEQHPPLKKLAPEPFSDAFSPTTLHAALQKSDQQIKLFLLDQTRVLGLGNIYAAEALHRAGVNPQLPAARLTRARATILHREIVHVLTEAIKNNGTINADPRDIGASYTGGVYESMTRVYERENLPCYECGTAIRRFTQGGRSTYHCPRCQRR
ncbi:MAG: bifunctional DNA-formamidopyrimidine glycosylase/DNA-(apurinic or apyrimidinic site) lyase [Blastocatellia bacterium]